MRVRTNFLGGLIEDNPLASGATTFTSAGLAALPAIGSTQHMPLILDPDGVGGAPEIVYVTAHTAAATTATITKGQEGTVARAHDRDIPWLHGPTVKDFDAPGGGVGLIGLTQYHPAANIAISVTSTTFADVDATNLVVSFTAPPSGKVLVRLSALFSTPGSGQNSWWNLRSGSSDVVDSEVYLSNIAASTASFFSPSVRISGLTPGTAYTWKWGAKNSGGSANLYVGRTASVPQGPAVMEVWAVNL